MSSHNYKVCARDWDAIFQKRFGEQYSIHLLSDTDIVNLIINPDFGRAKISYEMVDFNPIRVIEFQNDYD